MNILYISNHDLDQNTGVSAKIKLQVTEWMKEGHSVTVFTTKSLKIFDSNFECTRHFKRSARFLDGFKVLRVFLIHFFSLLVAFDLKPDIIYSRSFLFSPFFLLLELLYPVVIEINGDDVQELRPKKLLYFYNKFTRQFYLLTAKGFVCVSYELADKFSCFGKPILVSPNSVNESLLKFNRKRNLTNKFNLGFSGSQGQIWHGLDKILEFIKIDNRLHLHIIGIDGSNTPDMTFYGRVSMEENLEIVNSCDVCFSSMTPYRINMNEGSPLKSREYLGLGKPYIYAYEDTDFDLGKIEKPSFVLKVPNTENGLLLNRSKVVKFIETHAKTQVPVREFVKEKLVYSVREREKLIFMGTLTNLKD